MAGRRRCNIEIRAAWPAGKDFHGSGWPSWPCPLLADECLPLNKRPFAASATQKFLRWASRPLSRSSYSPRPPRYCMQ